LFICLYRYITSTGELDDVILLCKQTVDLVTRSVLNETGAMAQIKVWRQFLEKVEPHNIPVWNLIPRTYKSLQRLADSTSGTHAFCCFNVDILSVLHIFFLMYQVF
jgi:hypothetical protein